MFKPVGVPFASIETVTLTLDDVEALRLADLEGLYQEQAAERMKISRPTFARIAESARRKTADALIHGKAIRLEGGSVILKEETNMSDRDGTGPRRGTEGLGRGRCGCGQRQGWGRRHGEGSCRSRTGWRGHECARLGHEQSEHRSGGTGEKN